MKTLLIPIILTLFSVNTFCEEEKEKEFAVFPQFAYSQETGFWGGLITYYRYKLKTIPDHKNYLDFQILYTQKKQLQFKFFPIFHFNDGLAELKFEAKFMKWPSDFYGINNSDPKKEENKFTSEMIDFQADYQYRIRKNIFIHLYSDQMKSIIIKREDPTVFTGLPGIEPYFLSGVGTGIAFDSRDAEDFPSKGIFSSFKLNSYRNWWGSDYNFENIVLDLRQFVGFNRFHVFAFQQYFSYNSDTVPFHRLFKMGEYVRAFKDEIFLNNHGIAFRAEYRFFPFKGKIFQNIGFATFFDTGQGMQSLNELSISNFRCSFGAGLRISIFLKDRYNLRFDYGRCSTNGVMNIGGGETF